MQKDDRNPARDRELRMDRPIPRPDFRNGLAASAGGVAGHYELPAARFETFAPNIRDQLNRILGAGGCDGERDIAAITVNRWPHGDACEYNPLREPDGPIGKDHAISGDRPLAGSRLPTPTPPPAPIRLLTRPIVRCKDFRRVEARLSSWGGSNE
jgi:hypothetical protein